MPAITNRMLVLVGLGAIGLLGLSAFGAIWLAWGGRIDYRWAGAALVLLPVTVWIVTLHGARTTAIALAGGSGSGPGVPQLRVVRAAFREAGWRPPPAFAADHLDRPLLVRGLWRQFLLVPATAASHPEELVREVRRQRRSGEHVLVTTYVSLVFFCSCMQVSAEFFLRGFRRDVTLAERAFILAGIAFAPVLLLAWPVSRALLVGLGAVMPENIRRAVGASAGGGQADADAHPRRLGVASATLFSSPTASILTLGLMVVLPWAYVLGPGAFVGSAIHWPWEGQDRTGTVVSVRSERSTDAGIMGDLFGWDNSTWQPVVTVAEETVRLPAGGHEVTEGDPITVRPWTGVAALPWGGGGEGNWRDPDASPWHTSAPRVISLTLIFLCLAPVARSIRAVFGRPLPRSPRALGRHQRELDRDHLG